MIFANLKSARLFVFLLGVSFFADSSSAKAQLFPLMIEDDRPRVMIDRVEIEGESSVPGWLMAQTLEIPTGVLLSAVAASEILTEAERRLKATGRYTDNMVVKLVKGASYPHFVLHIRVEEISTWYWGIDANYIRSDLSDIGNEDSRADTLRTAAYMGNRNWRQTGWNLDLEVLDILVDWRRGVSKKSGSASNDWSFGLRQHLYGFAASAVQKQLWDDLFYFGVITRLYGITGTTRFESDYRATLSGGQQYHSQTEFSTQTNHVVPGIEAVAGARYKKFSLGTKAARYAQRSYYWRENSDTTQYIDGVVQPKSEFEVSFENEERWGFNNQLDVSVVWSDKSGLNLIEPGLDLRGQWTRNYYSNMVGTDAPRFYVLGQETIMIRDHFAGSLLAGGQWKFEKNAQNSPSVNRIIHVGGRVDYLARRGMVFFGEYYRTGAKQSETEDGDRNSDALLLRNRFNAGVRYASPSFIYAVSLGYGSNIAGEDQFSVDGTGSYRRMGVQ